VLAERARTHISTHFDAPLSASSIEKALGYNPDYLGRVFRHVHGHTLTEAVHRARSARPAGCSRRALRA
jgi:YesN/AraC family two-component response regulator